MNFYDTVAGRRFFEHQLPKLIEALQRISDELSRPQPVIQISAEGSGTFLRDLFYGEYEPDIWKGSPQSHEYDLAIKAHQTKMREALSPDLNELAVEYRKLLDDRYLFEMEKSFESGYITAVKMMMSGVAAPPHTKAGEVVRDA